MTSASLTIDAGLPSTLRKENTAFMSASPADIEKTVVEFLAMISKLSDDFTPDTVLYAGGAGLDSLETAELSATLEDTHGSDPYSAGQMPQTLNEILAFYASAQV
jgi:acyl carrier protein